MAARWWERSWPDRWLIDVDGSKLLCLVAYGLFLEQRCRLLRTISPGCALDVFLVRVLYILDTAVLTFTAGIGVGSIDCVIPVWSAEVSSHSARGAFLALEFVMVSLLLLARKT